MNEETIIEKLPTINGQQETKKEGTAWKQVTLGGVSGILMGGGLLYAGQVIAQKLSKDVVSPEQGETSHTLENGLQVAAVDDNLSFVEAFEQARAEVGPGGVFHWHGGIYNTYTAAEWNAMSVGQKHDFALQVKPEVGVDEISTPTDANTHVIVEHHVYHHQDSHPANDVIQAEETTEQVHVVDQQTTDTDDSDVHIVGYTEIQGHATVGLDMDGDGQADVAIIDVDDNQEVSNPDLVVDRSGNYATIGEIVNGVDPNMDVSNEAPDFIDDTSAEPDYSLYDI
jgi:hypothetical protein